MKFKLKYDQTLRVALAGVSDLIAAERKYHLNGYSNYKQDEAVYHILQVPAQHNPSRPLTFDTAYESFTGKYGVTAFVPNISGVFKIV